MPVQVAALALPARAAVRAVQALALAVRLRPRRVAPQAAHPVARPVPVV